MCFENAPLRMQNASRRDSASRDRCAAYGAAKEFRDNVNRTSFATAAAYIARAVVNKPACYYWMNRFRAGL